jgi:hypothetical protein
MSFKASGNRPSAIKASCLLMSIPAGQAASQGAMNGKAALSGLGSDGLGRSTSTRHTFTQLLHPQQRSGLMIIAWHGVWGFGT